MSESEYEGLLPEDAADPSLPADPLTEADYPEEQIPPEPLPPDPVVFTGMDKDGKQVKTAYSDAIPLAEGQRVQPAQGRLHPYEGELPADIETVWGEGRTDATGLPAENTARALIGAWGLERFRASGLHKLAVQESTRQEEMEPVRKAFIEAYTKKERG